MVFAAMLLACAPACAAQLPASVEKWNANPVAWSFRDGEAESFSLGGFATYLGAPRSAKVRVSASLTPAIAGTNGWATLGVALVDDDRNFWHLALVQAPPNADGRPGARFFELCESRNGRRRHSGRGPGRLRTDALRSAVRFPRCGSGWHHRRCDVRPSGAPRERGLLRVFRRARRNVERFASARRKGRAAVCVRQLCGGCDG